MKQFKITHLFFKNSSREFSEDTAPDWLTSVNSIPGSTMDMRWFWAEHVLTLDIGESIETDFNNILRIG